LRNKKGKNSTAILFWGRGGLFRPLKRPPLAQMGVMPFRFQHI